MDVADPENPWIDDVLDRKKYADYLTTSIKAQADFRGKTGSGLSISLDAGWGEGKSFFVKRWLHDLRNAGHLAIYFDAWENDVGDEAAVALMGAILKEVQSHRNKVSPADFADKIAHVAIKAKKKLRRAIFPTAAIVTKAAFKKVTGIAIEQLAEVWEQESTGSDTAEPGHGAEEKLLDDLFDQKLSEHASKTQAIAEFRGTLVELLTVSASPDEASAPAFVFIDELDRCRPSYAVALLEEAKHIFGVPGVTFVVSTNLAQLKHSVRALYGADFDGSGYLRRFFDREYVLPAGNIEKFSKYLLSDQSLFRAVAPSDWLPPGSSDAAPAVLAWSYSVQLFGLDLRTQKQVISLAEEVAVTLYSRGGVSFPWLFLVCIVYFKDRDFLLEIAAKRLNREQFMQRLVAFAKAAPVIKWVQKTRTSAESIDTPYMDILGTYFDLSTMDSRAILNRFNGDRGSYPDTILSRMFEELANPGPGNDGRLPEYASRAITAGYVVSG
jgi:hypothetical protein